MLEFISLLEIFIKGDGPGLLLFIFTSLIFMVIGNILYRAKVYVLSYHLSENIQTTLLERWWSGFIFIIRVISQAIGILKYFLPLSAGIILLSLAQLLYLNSPGIMLWSRDPEAEIGVLLLFGGGLAVIIGEIFWSHKLEQIDQSSMIYFSVRKIDVYAVFMLSGISIIFFVITHLIAGQFPFTCAMISIIIAIGSLLFGRLLLSNSNNLEPFYEYQQTRKLRDSGFRFSKPKDPSNKEDTEWWRTEQEDVPPLVYDPDFKFSKLGDPASNDERE